MPPLYYSYSRREQGRDSCTVSTGPSKTTNKSNQTHINEMYRTENHHLETIRFRLGKYGIKLNRATMHGVNQEQNGIKPRDKRQIYILIQAKFCFFCVLLINWRDTKIATHPKRFDFDSDCDAFHINIYNTKFVRVKFFSSKKLMRTRYFCWLAQLKANGARINYVFIYFLSFLLKNNRRFDVCATATLFSFFCC